MKLYRNLHVLLLVVIVLCCVSIAHGCVGAARVDAHAAKDAALVDAVNADATATEATRMAVQSSMDDAADMAGTAHSMVHAATGGDWKSLLLQLGVGALGLGATGVATYKKVNKDRDATSAERTAEDMAKLGKPVV